jgi:hypothetical protein
MRRSLKSVVDLPRISHVMIWSRVASMPVRLQLARQVATGPNFKFLKFLSVFPPPTSLLLSPCLSGGTGRETLVWDTRSSGHDLSLLRRYVFLS